MKNMFDLELLQQYFEDVDLHHHNCSTIKLLLKKNILGTNIYLIENDDNFYLKKK